MSSGVRKVTVVPETVTSLPKTLLPLMVMAPSGTGLGMLVSAGNAMVTLCTPSVRLAVVLNVMLYVAGEPAQGSTTTTVAAVTSAATGVAITLRLSTSPRATKILIIFFTSSFLLSCSQAV